MLYELGLDVDGRRVASYDGRQRRRSCLYQIEAVALCDGNCTRRAARPEGDAGAGAVARTIRRYVLRPPLAQGRVKLLGDGMVRIEFKRPFGDGTTAVDLDPLSLLRRLAASVPAPKFNTVRYGGVLAPAARWRNAVVPPAPQAPPEEAGAEERAPAREPPHFASKVVRRVRRIALLRGGVPSAVAHVGAGS